MRRTVADPGQGRLTSDVRPPPRTRPSPSLRDHRSRSTAHITHSSFHRARAINSTPGLPNFELKPFSYPGAPAAGANEQRGGACVCVRGGKMRKGPGPLSERARARGGPDRMTLPLTGCRKGSPNNECSGCMACRHVTTGGRHTASTRGWDRAGEGGERGPRV